MAITLFSLITYHSDQKVSVLAFENGLTSTVGDVNRPRFAFYHRMIDSAHDQRQRSVFNSNCITKFSVKPDLCKTP